MESLKARTRIWIHTGRKTVYGRGRALNFLIVPREYIGKLDGNAVNTSMLDKRGSDYLEL